MTWYWKERVQIKVAVSGLAMKQKLLRHFAVCLNNQGYEASLEVGKLYRVIDDEQAQASGLVRIVDESGEDYAFSTQRFYPVPQNVEEVLLAAV